MFDRSGWGSKLNKIVLKNGYLTTSCLLSHQGRGAYLKANKKFFCNTLLSSFYS